MGLFGESTTKAVVKSQMQCRKDQTNKVRYEKMLKYTKQRAMRLECAATT